MQNDKSPVREDEDVNIESMIMKTELAYTSSALPFTVIRNQYVYGGDQSPFLEYIINRLVRGMHVPLPLHGEQLLSLTHANDLGSLTLALGQSVAMNEIFNCGGQFLFITYKGLCEKVLATIAKPR